MTGPRRPGAGAGAGGVVADELRQLLASATGRPELAAVTPDTPLFGGGVGLDSLTGTLLLRQVRQRFGVDVAAEDLNLDALATLGTLTTFVCDRVVSEQVVSDRAVYRGP
jgi:acyl carrier protein